MTREEAIERIEDHMMVHRMGKYPHLKIKEALDLALSALRGLTQNDWVRVEDKLPENDVPENTVQVSVLVLTDRGTVKIKNRRYHPARIYYGKFYPERWDWGTFNDDHITHWMPLPVPPEKYM